MTRNADQAIAHCFNQSVKGPGFDAGWCKRETREAYDVPSDGSDSATEAWSRTDHRLKVGGASAPRGALLWWTGGSDGHGHVAIADGKGGVWSVDVKRAGYWDHVPFIEIRRWAPQLVFVGVSADIDGVQVIPLAAPAPTMQTPASVPTVHDLRVALERFARETKNPVYKSLFTDAVEVLGLEDAGNHVKVPVTLDGVREALLRKSVGADQVLRNRLASVYELIRGL